MGPAKPRPPLIKTDDSFSWPPEVEASIGCNRGASSSSSPSSSSSQSKPANARPEPANCSACGPQKGPTLAKTPRFKSIYWGAFFERRRRADEPSGDRTGERVSNRENAYATSRRLILINGAASSNRKRTMSQSANSSAVSTGSTWGHEGSRLNLGPKSTS